MSLKNQIGYDLFEAMKSRKKEEISILRVLLGEIANAEAVEVDTSHVPMNGRTADVPRRVLTEDDIRQILLKEVDNHNTAIAEYEEFGSQEAADQLHFELRIINRYLE